VGALCDIDVVAFLRSVVKQTITLPNGAIITPTTFTEGEVLLPGAPGAIVQVVLRDPFPLPISYEEDAVRDITQYIPGYTILYEDLVDLVNDHAGLPATLDPSNIPIVTVQAGESPYDNTVSTPVYIANLALIGVIGAIGVGIAYSVVVSMLQIGHTHVR
jgi:hypothetical protein